jgi:hypothetical protein
VRESDPRADPTVVDLIELAGLWLAAENWRALGTALGRLHVELSRRYQEEVDFRARFAELAQLAERVERGESTPEDLRSAYRRATLG